MELKELVKGFQVRKKNNYSLSLYPPHHCG